MIVTLLLAVVALNSANFCTVGIVMHTDSISACVVFTAGKVQPSSTAVSTARFFFFPLEAFFPLSFMLVSKR